MHVDLLYPSEYLCAADLRGKDVTLTISKFRQEELHTNEGDEIKWVISFKEMEERHHRDKTKTNKRLVVNKKSHPDAIRAMHGDETDNWIGKKITLFVDRCMSFGEMVDCIRIRDKES